MGIFDDKQYNELDWISQAVQPIISPLTQILESIPERTDVSDIIISHKSNYSSSGWSLSELLSGLIENVPGGEKLRWDERSILEECFALDMTGDGYATLNLTEQTLSEKIFLVKTKFTLEDDRLKTTLGVEGLRALRDIKNWSMDISRANEMLELLEKCDDVLRSRSTKLKRQALSRRLSEILHSNEWMIKSTDLANKIGMWIASYICTGNLAALSNITRLKVITYKGAPIYSIEEQV
jgi:hypothetical protein